MRSTGNRWGLNFQRLEILGARRAGSRDFEEVQNGSGCFRPIRPAVRGFRSARHRHQEPVNPDPMPQFAAGPPRPARVDPRLGRMTHRWALIAFVMMRAVLVLVVTNPAAANTSSGLQRRVWTATSRYPVRFFKIDASGSGATTAFPGAPNERTNSERPCSAFGQLVKIDLGRIFLEIGLDQACAVLSESRHETRLRESKSA